VTDELRQMWEYLTSDAAWSGRNGIPALMWAHIQISLVAVLIAAVVAIPTAILLGHVRRGAFLAVSVVNIGRAIPSFAVMALVLPFSLRYGFGLGFWPTIVALVLLALPPIFTNTYTGVRDVPEDAVEAARGMGMRTRQVVSRVEVPVAVPLIVTGLRVSAVQVIATATLGALVAFRDLGTPIITGYTSPDKGSMLAGALAVIVLALLTDALFAVSLRWLVPWRRTPGRASDVTVVAAPTEAAPGGATPTTGPTGSTANPAGERTTR
jgi:osmoprotectant transport system permease protein